jgi:FKBP-type peptidyl-prolyl cis-trans isomerase SlyD
MAEIRPIVADGLLVGLDYTLRLDDQEVIDTSTGRGPLEFVQGQGRIVSGLEQALYGMSIGDEKDVVVAPAEGYGERDPDALQAVSRDIFPPDVTLEPEIAFRMHDDQGRMFVAYVADVQPEDILLDFNHPLAGETLYFHVKISALRAATAEDLGPGCGTCGGCSPEGCAC